VVRGLETTLMTTNDNDELWYVQMDNGDLRELTLDELDEAFNAGLIHENTYVMEVGASEWQTLADVAGLNEEEPAPAPAPTYAPQAMGARPLPNLVPHQSQYPAPTSAAMSASAWPPVVQASGYAARPTPASVVPFAGGPQSTAPVVHDLSDLDLNPPFKKRGMGLWVAAAAVVVLGGAGFAATQVKGGLAGLTAMAKGAPPEVAAAMTAPPAAEPAPAPKPAPLPEPAPVAKEEKKEAADKAPARSMSDELKERLKSADETRAKERKQKRSARATKTSRRSSGGKKSGGSNPFRSGGSGSDPLNGKL
jgi:hypothetical protein